MCGIFGYVGRSTDRKATFELATSLFQKTEIRGHDASGFYAAAPGGADAQVLWDKEPLKSTEYVKTDVWKTEFANFESDLLIAHCRQTSAGVGPESINKNNHPHVAGDLRTAMVHNGKIPEYTALKDNYSLTGDCDSEILLRMFESARTIISADEEARNRYDYSDIIKHGLIGLEEIFSRVSYGAMAVALAQRPDDGSRFLWLFRDDERPLWVTDLRKEMGQMWFFSTPEIWRHAVEATPSVRGYVSPDQWLVEQPAHQCFLLAHDLGHTGEEGNWNIRKFQVVKTREEDHRKSSEDEKRNFKATPADPPPFRVICRLNQRQEIPVADPDPVLKPPEGQKKNKVGTAGCNGVDRGGLKPPVQASIALLEEGRDDEDTWTELSEEITLETVNSKIDKIMAGCSKIKELLNSTASSSGVTGREMSQIYDNLRVVDTEMTSVTELLNKA